MKPSPSSERLSVWPNPQRSFAASCVFFANSTTSGSYTFGGFRPLASMMSLRMKNTVVME